MIIDFKDPVSMQATTTFLATAKMEAKIVGLTSGCFDMYHYMHLRYLERCRSHCDLLIVGVDSDEMIRWAIFPFATLITEARRLAIINDSKQVAMAFIMNSISDFSFLWRNSTPTIQYILYSLVVWLSRPHEMGR